MWFLHRFLELGITRGIERHWGMLIYVRIAALNVSTPVVDNSTLPSSFWKKCQFRRENIISKTNKIEQ